MSTTHTMDVLVFIFKALVTMIQDERKIMDGNNECIHASLLNSMSKEYTTTPQTHYLGR